MSFMVCLWPQSQEGDWARPHLCKLAWCRPWPVRKRFIRDHVWQGRSKPGCLIVGSVTIVWLTTEADDQSSLYCATVSIDVMSDRIGCRYASRGDGCSNTPAYIYISQFGWASMIWSILSVAALPLWRVMIALCSCTGCWFFVHRWSPPDVDLSCR